MRKNYTQHNLLLVTLAVLVVGSACKKTKSPPAPPTTVSFSMKDTLIIASQYASTDPDIYAKYNGKTYAVNSTDKTEIIPRRIMNSGQHFMLFFQDNSVDMLHPYFEVNIKNTDVDSFQSEYDLRDASRIQLHYHQRLKDGSLALNVNGKVLSGTLKISYDKQYNTVSGEITNLQVPIDFYTPEDVALQLPTRSNMLILEGGSYRTASLKFNYAKISDAP